jgi:DNA-3-methyladenine glycosylase
MKLNALYFQNTDTLALSKDLLGKFLCSNINGKLTAGMIMETEAYLGADDHASHAFGSHRTKRTEVMYLEGGHLYVYLCYGIHTLLNIVSHQADEPHAILIRALKPEDGIETMLKRRHMIKPNSKLTSGPGALSQALGITTKLTGEPLGKTVWIEDRGIHISKQNIIASPRVGVAYAKEDALLPYRFRIKTRVMLKKRK